VLTRLKNLEPEQLYSSICLSVGVIYGLRFFVSCILGSYFPLSLRSLILLVMMVWNKEGTLTQLL